MSIEIEAENLGPLPKLRVKLVRYGVNVLTAPNGKGKTIFLEGCQSLASGKGKAPLMRGESRGYISGMGARITLTPSRSRHVGEFQVESLESSFDISKLVDPGIKDPEAADKRRINQLLTLTGVEGSKDVWTAHELFNAEEIDQISPEGVLIKDIVDQAAQIAKDYQGAARQFEKLAKEDQAQADAIAKQLEALEGVEVPDVDTCAKAVERAQNAFNKLSVLKGQYQTREREAEQGKATIERLKDSPPTDQAQSALDTVTQDIHAASTRISELEAELTGLRQKMETMQIQEAKALQEYNHACFAEGEIAKANKAIEKFGTMTCPTEEDRQKAQAVWDDAREELKLSAKVGELQGLVGSKAVMEASAEKRRKHAERYRAASDVTALILSEQIPPGPFSVNAKRRLVVQHPDQGEIEYELLSAAEKWSLAYKLYSEQLGEGALCVLPQEPWEGMDVWTRQLVDKLGVEHKLYVLTAEATRDEQDGKDMELKPYGEHQDAELLGGKTNVLDGDNGAGLADGTDSPEAGSVSDDVPE